MWVFKQPLGVQACLRCMFGCVSVVLACACAYATARTGAVHHMQKKKKQVIFWLVWFRMFDSAALNTQIFSTAQVGA